MDIGMKTDIDNSHFHNHMESNMESNMSASENKKPLTKSELLKSRVGKPNRHR